MAYKKPTEKGIQFAMEFGWNREQAERGYEIFDYDGTGILDVEAILDCYPSNEFEESLGSGEILDEVWAHEAEITGFCKIIPVEELPKNFEHEGNSLRWYGWVDTPENRKAIEEYCQ